ncbi:MAG: helix-turn-helix transcriptional regulator, partial [Bacteroidetes bacterium]|nr:helix-turn-helix transcriptional regulator [Bacteroidota bacterium]
SKKITQEEIQSETGILRTTISNIEKGKQQPSVHILWSIATALNTDLFELIPKKDLIESYLRQNDYTNFNEIINKENLKNSSKDIILQYITKI